MSAAGYESGFKLALHPKRLVQPLARRKPTVYFVNSMSDLFHYGVPDTFLGEVFEVIEKTPHHTYQILTKRAERRACGSWSGTAAACGRPPPAGVAKTGCSPLSGKSPRPLSGPADTRDGVAGC